MTHAAVVDEVEVRALSFATSAPESDGTLTWDHTNVVTVEVRAGPEVGLGWSYTSPAAVEIIRSVLAPEVLGEDSSSPGRLWERMHRACRNLGTRGVAMAAISAMDIAFWDLRSKALRVPLADLWGAHRDSVPVYGSGGFTSMDDGQLDEQVEAWLSAGCSALKLKIGENWGRNLTRDLDRVARVMARVRGDAQVMVDANGGYSRSQAMHVGQDLDLLGVTWFEEPVSSEDLPGLGQLSDALNCEVAAGEYIAEISDARSMCEAVDCVQLDVTRCGGYTGWRRCAAYAHAVHVPVSGHGAPALHLPLALADHTVRHTEWFSDHVTVEEQLIEGAPAVRNGQMSSVRPAALGHGYRLKDVSRFAVDDVSTQRVGMRAVTSLDAHRPPRLT
ncbi:mandelate racemase [Flexivirga endophytica]|uniref:Mandelate racemase n=1 Tax=Flexivirga endophytica TaxID=1849103 RepID=A0A916WVB9_9MICO|nr:enolase C-terminal domain-like protein [Flexivirga endophytica]GGB35563.1 mandelate racemase [Flexivirga endophytica]GHB43277.1 mandelate racemase [Flexivirga endophytica]